MTHKQINNVLSELLLLFVFIRKTLKYDIESLFVKIKLFNDIIIIIIHDKKFYHTKIYHWVFENSDSKLSQVQAL